MARLRKPIPGVDGKVLIGDAAKLLPAPSRRLFLRGAASVGALAALTGCDIIDGPTAENALRVVSNFNDWVQARLFSSHTLAPTFSDSEVTRPFPFNAYYQQEEAPDIDGDKYQLEIGGLVDNKKSWSLPELYKLPEVSQITRLATRPLAVLTIQNTDTATNQRATIDKTATGVNLTRVASGVATTSTLLYATYPTLTALAGAITALANGWTATVAIGYSLWPSADLKPLQGAVTAINSAANLELFTEDLSAWMGGNWFDSDFGMVCSGPGWRLDADSGIIVGYFPQGYYNIRIDYSAGFATDPDSMPADLQDACVKGAAFLQSAGKWNPASNSIQIGPFKETNQQIVPGFASAVMSLISPYIDHAKTMGWSRP